MRLLCLFLLACLSASAQEEERLADTVRRGVTARLAQAERQLDRARSLVESGVASDAEVERARLVHARCVYHFELLELEVVRTHPLVTELQTAYGVLPVEKRPAERARARKCAEATVRYLTEALALAEKELERVKRQADAQLASSEELWAAEVALSDLQLLYEWERAELERLEGQGGE